MLLNSGVGQGLFFAGLKHVAIQVIASFSEDKIVTTNPEELLAQSAANQEFETQAEPTQPKAELPAEPVALVPTPVVAPVQTKEEEELAKGFTENSDAVLTQPVVVAPVPVAQPEPVTPPTPVVEEKPAVQNVPVVFEEKK